MNQMREEFEKWVKVNGLSGGDVYDADSDGDGLVNYLEQVKRVVKN